MVATDPAVKRYVTGFLHSPHLYDDEVHFCVPLPTRNRHRETQRDAKVWVLRGTQVQVT